VKHIFVSILCLIAVTAFASEIFVVNSGSQTLSRIDLETGDVNNAFAVLGNLANRVAASENDLYVVNSGDNSIQKISMENGNTLSNIYIGSTSNPYDILIQQNTAYVTGALSNKVYFVDLLTESVMEEVTVGGNPAGMAIWQNKLYVGNTDYASGYTNCSISVIDLNINEVIETIPTDPNPQYLITYNDMIHVSCTGNWSDISGSIQIIDPQQNAVIQTLPIGGYPGSLTALGNGIIYIGDSMSSGIYAYNSASYEVIYDADSPFLPGASTVTSDGDILATLGGEWGQNFTVNTYDENEALSNSFQVGLYATDLIIVQAAVGTEDDLPEFPETVLTNYPNPFNPSTTISFQVSINSYLEDLEILIYNLKGQIIKDLSSAVPLSGVEGSAGNGTVTWNGLNDQGETVVSGVYFARLLVDGKSFQRKLVLLK